MLFSAKKKKIISKSVISIPFLHSLEEISVKFVFLVTSEHYSSSVVNFCKSEILVLHRDPPYCENRSDPTGELKKRVGMP
jgi:hypothetical protein